jgi:peptide/nickel transport system permease protein
LNSINDTEINENERNNSFDTIKTEFIDLGHFLLQKLKSPFTILGLVIIVFLIIISIFPQILTPYTLADANGIFAGAWSPPSPDHLLGQTKFGRDVLVRIIYGIADSLVFSVNTVLICVAGALVIGVPLILLNRRLKISAEVVLFPILIVPPIFIFPLIINIFFMAFSSSPSLSLILGLYLFPFFTYLIAKEHFSVYSIGKKAVTYIPLFIGLTILIYIFIGMLGFSSPLIIQLGNEIAEARVYMYPAPWAVLFPGIAILIILLGFFILYAGLQKSPKEIQELKRDL